MRRCLLIAGLFFMLVACKHNNTNLLPADVINNPASAEEQQSKQGRLPAITFETTTYDFGQIYQGERVKYSFKFTNTGTSDLIISRVSASCGCTVAEYPKKPIKPGEGGSITVEFNSAGRRGQQSKTVSVSTNAQPPTVVLTITAMVVEP